jgi:hypothetical protein
MTRRPRAPSRDEVGEPALERQAVRPSQRRIRHIGAHWHGRIG